MTRSLRALPQMALALLSLFPLVLGARAQSLSDRNPPNTIYTPLWNLGETMKQPLPEYPQDAKQQHVSGKVDLRILIGFDGTVKDTMVVSGDPLLVPSAVAAVQGWKYRPPTLRNAPTQVVTRIILYYIMDACPGEDATAPAAFVAFRPSVNQDLSCGQTFTEKISPDLPEYTFKLIPGAPNRDRFGNAQTTVQDVEVFRAGSDQPLQNLGGCDLREMQPPPPGSDWFKAEDYNFDGYLDIYVMAWWGATGNQGGCVWLFDPATGRFTYSKEFSELGALGVGAKTLSTYSKGGLAGAVHHSARYSVENNQPVLVWSEDQDFDSEAMRFHCVVRERRGSDMVTVLDQVGSSSDDAPCK
jgi:TonB family protein